MEILQSLDLSTLSFESPLSVVADLQRRRRPNLWKKFLSNLYFLWIWQNIRISKKFVKIAWKCSFSKGPYLINLKFALMNAVQVWKLNHNCPHSNPSSGHPKYATEWLKFWIQKKRECSNVNCAYIIGKGLIERNTFVFRCPKDIGRWLCLQPRSNSADKDSPSTNRRSSQGSESSENCRWLFTKTIGQLIEMELIDSIIYNLIKVYCVILLLSWVT
jgi:hypothetical protein